MVDSFRKDTGTWFLRKVAVFLILLYCFTLYSLQEFPFILFFCLWTASEDWVPQHCNVTRNTSIRGQYPKILTDVEVLSGSCKGNT